MCLPITVLLAVYFSQYKECVCGSIVIFGLWYVYGYTLLLAVKTMCLRIYSAVHFSPSLKILSNLVAFNFNVLFSYILVLQWPDLHILQTIIYPHIIGSMFTFVCEALSDPAKSIMNSFPCLIRDLILSVVWSVEVCCTLTLSSAWEREEVLLAAVGSTVRARFPFWSRFITWGAHK